ncbi:MAG: sensor signal transduction histidine kinase, partial [Planctomycetaceae bacterium]|nr:sensor signal transduction histidine kinase [Planctomycetaceae bacterium]
MTFESNHIFDALPGLVWTAHPDGRIDFLNRRWCQYTGLSLQEASGWGWQNAIFPADLPQFLDQWRSIVASGQPGEMEARLRRFDAEHRWFLFRLSPLTEASGQITKWCGINTDIEEHKQTEVIRANARRLNQIINTIPTTAWSTLPDGYCDFLNQRKWHGTVVDMHDRKRAEDELQRSEARKTAILDSALDCIMTIDHEGRITEFNPAAERTFGYQRENVLGKLLAEVIIPPSLRERHRQGLARYLATGEMRMLGKRVELTAIRADGNEFPVEVAITRIPSDGPASFTGYLRDITERKRAEEELRRSEAGLREAQNELAFVTRVTTMGELAASIAHEVNQPIAGVVINGNACLRWLSREKEASVNLTEARVALQRIIRDGNRAGEIIARIRALFKKTETAKEPLDLNETIREVIVLTGGEMNKQQVVLRLELPFDLPRVVGDRIQLQQVLLNLILNAIDAMATVNDKARSLVVQTQSREEREVMVTVRDTGIGIHPDRIEHVFTAFHTTKPGGLGMGLSISRSIVENHSGRLWMTAH